jgi:UDP-N-acetylmuramoylalanine--D-glutamate ligase
LAGLADLNIEYRLGRHEVADFTAADLVVVNPAVDRRNNPYIQAAVDAGVPLTSEIELLIERLPNRRRTIGITGTAGKSTTTAMVGHVLTQTLGPGRVHVGGNIGGSLLGRLSEISGDDWVVLELSSFMLEAMRDFSPHIAVVTNISDNHLDRHGTMDLYAAAKQRILRHQAPGDLAVLGKSVAEWRHLTPASHVIIDVPFAGELLVPGEHNRLNAAAAVAVCGAANILPIDIARALASFPGLPHRLQLVCEHAGRRFYNDSKSTTPDSAMLAIDAFAPGMAHVILGGYDKHADLAPLARHAAQKCAGIYTIGATGEAIADAAEAAGGAPVHRCGELEAAVKAAVKVAGDGQAVVLSPGCASWDQFDNFEARGRMFAEYVLRCTTET